MREGRRADRREDALHLPVPTRPLAEPAVASVEMILAASAEMLPVWNADAGNEERRLARKSGERFSIRDPDTD